MSGAHNNHSDDQEAATQKEPLPKPKKTERAKPGLLMKGVAGAVVAIIVITSTVLVLRGWEKEEDSNPARHATVPVSAPAMTEPANHCVALPRVRGMAPPVKNTANPNDPSNWTDLVPGEPGCTLHRSVGLRVQCMNMQGQFVDYNTTACAQGLGERYGSPFAEPMPYTAHYMLTEAG